MSTSPQVSVVIPTRGRPSLVGRAVASALHQTFRDLEVVVVVDGADAATEAVIAAVTDRRLRVIRNEAAVGGAEARNIGVRHARGSWIAFLDDDDEWLAAKLDRQLSAIAASDATEPIASCAIYVRQGNELVAWRSPIPARGEHIADYLWVRRSLRYGEGTVGTSTILARRDLLERVPFDAGVERYQDADWLLRAWALGARLVFCAERLSIWSAPDPSRPSITGVHASDWRSALEWIRARRSLVTPRAYAAFVLVRVAALAARSGDLAARSVLWREARTRGRPRPFDVGLFLARWVMPAGLRTLIRRRAAATTASGDGP